jgi:hypothetical protein
MTQGVARRQLLGGLVSQAGIPLLLGLITLVSLIAGGMSVLGSVELGALVTVGFMLVLLFIDLQTRISALDERTSAGFSRLDRAARLARLMELSALDTTLLTDLMEAVGAADDTTSPLLQGLARREIERITWFVKQLPLGSEIAYDGEDREWLLGLTAEAQHSIDAISLSTVDAGLRGFDGGLWTSDLGTRYLELQREAIDRKVAIRRIFIFENEDLSRDETFLKITQMQRDVNVEVRMLDHQLIPERLQSMIFDFIIFDGALSYESTTAATFNADETRPAIVRTRLALMPPRVRDLQNQFEQLWKAADPDRQIGG